MRTETDLFWQTFTLGVTTVPVYLSASPRYTDYGYAFTYFSSIVLFHCFNIHVTQTFGLPQVCWGWTTPGTPMPRRGPTASCPGCVGPEQRSARPGCWWSQGTWGQNAEPSAHRIRIKDKTLKGWELWSGGADVVSLLFSSSTIFSKQGDLQLQPTAHLCHDNPHPISQSGWRVD